MVWSGVSKYCSVFSLDMRHTTVLLEKPFLTAQRKSPGAIYESVSYLLGIPELQTGKEKSEKETASMLFGVGLVWFFFFFLQC